MRIDPDAVLWSAPERERAGRPLLVLLHGYGSHEGDLFSLSPQLPLAPVVASVRAPIAEMGGFAWFSLPRANPLDLLEADVDAAASAVLNWLDTLEYTSVSLLGFSQGAAVALQANRLAPGRVTATVALSGFVPRGERPGDTQLAELRPPVFWGRGTLDSVIPAEAIEHTDAWLPAHADATVRIYEGLAHSINAAELADFAQFLRENAGY